MQFIINVPEATPVNIEFIAQTDLKFIFSSIRHFLLDARCSLAPSQIPHKIPNVVISPYIQDKHNSRRPHFKIRVQNMDTENMGCTICQTKIEVQEKMQWKGKEEW